MLYQTLVAAVVLSCTCCEPIVGRPRVDQIKDILCVMLLSGVQKDDLDSNTLKNLQRHNVNVDDLDNAKKRQSCAAANLQNDMPFKSTTETSTTTLKIPSTSTVTEHTATESTTKTIVNAKLTDLPITDTNQETVDSSKLESISKFWDIISTNLWKILPKNAEDLTTTKQPFGTTAMRDMLSTKPNEDDVSFDEIILGKEIPKKDANVLPYFPISRTTTENVNDKTSNNANLEKEPINKNEGFVDFLDKIEDFQYDTTTTPRIVYLARRKETLPDKKNSIKEEKDIKGKSEPNILEIANQVRQLLLKDIKKEIIKDVVVTTTIAATAGTTLNYKSFDVLEAKTVMDRFLHLCRHLKLDPATIDSNLKPNNLQTKFIKPETMPRVTNLRYGKKNIAKSLPMMQSTNNAYYPVKTQPKIHETFANSRIKNRIIPKTIQTNSGQIPPLPIPINVKGKIGNYMKLVENQNIVITPKTTIQKHEMISKNRKEELSKKRIEKIIQTPKKDDEEYEELKTDFRNKVRKPIAHENFFETSTLPVTHRYKKPKKEHKPNQDIYEDLIDEKTIMRSLEMINQPKLESMQQYQVQSNIESVRNIIEQNQKKFESLRNISEDFIEESDESPINQRPLAPISKTMTNYDDKHFNNFLKTQEKVNDMLEMILSSKSKRLLSIETI